MFSPFLDTAKLFVQYVLSYWTSQVNYTVFIKLILDFDQQWKHNPQWDQLLLFSQLLFSVLHRWVGKKPIKYPSNPDKIFRFHTEGKAAKCRWALEISVTLSLFLFRFLSGLALILNSLLTSHVTMGSLLQWMDVCHHCSAGILFPPSGVAWCSACLGSVKFRSSLPNKWGICPDRDLGCDSSWFFFLYFSSIW